MLTLIIGGVRSGKSTAAETIAAETGASVLHYIATSVPTDDEMNQRIRNHQVKREAASEAWLTYEHSTNLLKAPIPKGAVIVLDCLTTWAANEWMETSDDDIQPLISSIMGQIEKIHQHGKELIIVSNDLFSDAISFSDSVQSYLSLMGGLHQKLVQRADTVIQMEFGQKRIRKGVRT